MGAPVVVRTEEQSSENDDPERFIRTIQVRSESGEMETASKVLITGFEEKEKQCLLEGEWTEFDKYPNLIFATSNDQVVKVDGRNGACK